MEKKYLEELEEDIKKAATENVEKDEAERLAAKFLLAQIEVSKSLRRADLTARLNKAAVKEKKASVYLAEVAKADKKPSDVLLEQIVNTDKGVWLEQSKFDASEVERDSLQDYFDVFKDSHIYFRSVGKGRFDG